nr:MAG TPA: hypothetical protein [Caudoviricetes sp.]
MRLSSDFSTFDFVRGECKCVRLTRRLLFCVLTHFNSIRV